MDDETKVWPPHKHAFEQLVDQLGYGAQFKWEEVCELLGVDLNKRHEWKFLQEWFALKGLRTRQSAARRSHRGAGRFPRPLGKQGGLHRNHGEESAPQTKTPKH